VIVHGAPDPHDPAGPITQTVAIMPPAYPSRRAMREAEQAAARRPEVTGTRAEPVRAAQPPRADGPLAGSVLSPATWRQTFDALKKLR
jgi:hypothetical protein